MGIIKCMTRNQRKTKQYVSERVYSYRYAYKRLGINVSRNISAMLRKKDQVKVLTISSFGKS